MHSGHASYRKYSGSSRSGSAELLWARGAPGASGGVDCGECRTVVPEHASASSQITEPGDAQAASRHQSKRLRAGAMSELCLLTLDGYFERFTQDCNVRLEQDLCHVAKSPRDVRMDVETD